MTRVIDDRVVTAVEQYFSQPDIAVHLDHLCRRLPNEAQILIAGGAIRNLIIKMMHGSTPATKDIDLFISGVSPDFNVAAVLGELETRPTDLGGLRWQPQTSPYAFDLCLVPHFIIIHTYGLEPTLKALLTGLDLTINAIIYDYRHQILYENGCLAAIRDRCIDFNCQFFPDKCLIAYRLLLMAHKTGFRFSKATFHFLTQRLDVETLGSLKRLMRVKQGKALAKTIMQRLDRLFSYATYSVYLDSESLKKLNRPEQEKIDFSNGFIKH